MIRICRPLVLILNLGKKPAYLADGASIKDYLAEVIEEQKLTSKNSFSASRA